MVARREPGVTGPIPERLGDVTYTLPSMKSPRILLAAICVAVLSIAVSGCASAGGASPTSGCDHWCGNASARVTFLGQTTTISGGGCYDSGAAGMDVRIGDWAGDGSGDYLMLSGYRPGTVPAATAIATDDAGNPQYTPAVAGSVGGTPFTLDDHAQVTFNSASTGTFSGTDVNGFGDLTGTFSCK